MFLCDFEQYNQLQLHNFQDCKGVYTLCECNLNQVHSHTFGQLHIRCLSYIQPQSKPLRDCLEDLVDKRRLKCGNQLHKWLLFHNLWLGMGFCTLCSDMLCQVDNHYPQDIHLQVQRG